jgi:choline dehydrogenase-like flavoprotein
MAGAHVLSVTASRRLGETDRRRKGHPLQHDARSIPSGSLLQPDVCIVGAGPVGIAVGLALARAGARVLLLEAGGRKEEEADRRHTRGESVGEPYVPLHRSRVRGFGGTSLHWLNVGLFRATPLDTLDFETRQGIPHSGWPMSRTDLDPYYAQAVSWCGLGDSDFSVKRWETPERPALQFKDDTVRTVVFQRARIDEWKRRFDEVTGTAGLDLVMHAHVTGMHADADGTRIARLTVRTTSDTVFTVKARAIVLATGGIENARMLLVNRDRFPNGLGNGHDLVGRFFQEHLAIRGGVIRPSRPELARELGLYYPHVAGDGTPIHAKLAVGEQVLRERQLLNGAFFVTYVSDDRADDTTRSLAILRRVPTWRPVPPRIGHHVWQVTRNVGRMTRAAVEELRNARRPDTLQLLAEAEQAPNPESRVTLSPRSRDAFGLPTARLAWRLTDLDRRAIKASQEIIDAALERSGIGRLEGQLDVERAKGMFAGCFHHMGTTRMSDDPRHGVVDRDCRVHGLNNLFVGGSSVFPTSGHANPTFTIVALALRLADHLKVTLPSLTVP